MEKGIIVKGVGGFYDVLIDDEIVRCRARGIFRKDGISPMVGDRVMVSTEDLYIDEILERKNRLLRPIVSNIDILGIVVALRQPEPDFLLVDKLIVNAELNNVDIILIVNKIDLIDKDDIKDIFSSYRKTNYPTVALSCPENYGFDELEKEIDEKIITFAGQSGVGKSSIINILSSKKLMETGKLSDRLGRGKHTTRHTELIRLISGGMLVDTPGFTTMEIDEMEIEELPFMYRDFFEYSKKCRFTSCLHDQEPFCGIKKAVEEKKLPKERYERYIRLLNELREQRRKKW